MNPTPTSKMLAAACCLITLTASAAAQQTPKPLPAPPAKQAAPEHETTAKNSPSEQGIKIHGHWILQVKNADGTLGQRREFDNSLISTSASSAAGGGDQLLAAALSGDITMAGLAVGLVQGAVTASGADPTQFCVASPNRVGHNINYSCYGLISSTSLWAQQNGFQAGVAFASFQTVLAAGVTFTPPVAIGLSGNFSVPSGLTEIDAVQTLGAFCVPNNAAYLNSSTGELSGTSVAFSQSTAAPTGCATENLTTSTNFQFAPFTSTSVPTPLTGLTVGQVITVTVTLSFS